MTRTHQDMSRPGARERADAERTSTAAPSSRRSDAVGPAVIPQYSLLAIVAVWAAAALPMGVLAWAVAPALATRLAGDGVVAMAKALLTCLTVGLIWQFVLVAVLVWRERHTCRWTTIRKALWLHPPQSPRSGRRGGRTWLILLPLIALFAAEDLLPNIYQPPATHNMRAFLASDAGQRFLSGNWRWFALLVVLWVFNTVLGEELLFRGLLLPRMHGAFGRGDWAANGALFAAYHLHMPWSVPAQLANAFVLAYPTKRYRSAWIGIAVHSAQSVVLAAIVLILVLR